MFRNERSAPKASVIVHVLKQWLRCMAGYMWVRDDGGWLWQIRWNYMKLHQITQVSISPFHLCLVTYIGNLVCCAVPKIDTTLHVVSRCHNTWYHTSCMFPSNERQEKGGWSQDADVWLMGDGSLICTKKWRVALQDFGLSSWFSRCQCVLDLLGVYMRYRWNPAPESVPEVWNVQAESEEG